MKKIEIINLIRANRIIDKNSKLLSITRDKRFPNIKIDIEYWFPDIEELKGEFEILKKEVLDVQKESNECKQIIQKSKCNHEVRLKHFGLFGSHSNCIFCNKTIMGDNCVNWEYSVNRNNYCVDFIAKYQDDEDYDYVDYGYTKEEIYSIIENILKDKQDNEEIDLVQEIKKLNKDNCYISQKPIKKETYILILNGTNKYYLDKETYIQNNNRINIAIEVLKYLSNLLNTKVELIDNEKLEIENSNSNIRTMKYETYEELNKMLLEQQDIPFKIIIDITQLFDYNIENKEIKRKEIVLELEKIYPNSRIIRIGNLSNKRKEEIIEFLKRYTEIVYAYQNKNYYSLQSNELLIQNQDELLLNIKRLLVK